MDGILFIAIVSTSALILLLINFIVFTLLENKKRKTLFKYADDDEKDFMIMYERYVYRNKINDSGVYVGAYWGKLERETKK